MSNQEILEISVECDGEAAEAVSELFNRYNGGDYDEDSEAGEASGSGTVIESIGLDDFGQPVTHPPPVGQDLRQARRTRRRNPPPIEDGLWRLSLLYPIPTPQVRTLREGAWAHAWKKYYKPLRVGRPS